MASEKDDIVVMTINGKPVRWPDGSPVFASDIKPGAPFDMELKGDHYVVRLPNPPMPHQENT